MVSARAIFFESPLPLERWNKALPRLMTIAASTTRTRILMGSMRRDFILPAPMPIRFSAFGRVFAPSWPMTLATVVLLAVFVSLGRWQWHRGEAKQLLWEKFESAPVPVLSSTPPNFDTIDRYSRVAFDGRFEPTHSFLLDNRSHRGQPGFEVLTPFVLKDGRRILVNRGWIPFSGYRDKLPDVSMKSRFASVSGRVEELPEAGLASGRAAPDAGDRWPKLTSFPTHEQLRSALGEKISRRILLMDPNNLSEDFYVREWSPPGVRPDRHFSYAIQWWGFAVVLLVIYFGLNFRKVS
jgi:surfeit locus 1 family protein